MASPILRQCIDCRQTFRQVSRIQLWDGATQSQIPLTREQAQHLIAQHDPMARAFEYQPTSTTALVSVGAKDEIMSYFSDDFENTVRDLIQPVFDKEITTRFLQWFRNDDLTKDDPTLFYDIKKIQNKIYVRAVIRHDFCNGHESESPKNAYATTSKNTNTKLQNLHPRSCYSSRCIQRSDDKILMIYDDKINICTKEEIMEHLNYSKYLPTHRTVGNPPAKWSDDKVYTELLEKFKIDLRNLTPEARGTLLISNQIVLKLYSNSSYRSSNRQLIYNFTAMLVSPDFSFVTRSGLETILTQQTTAEHPNLPIHWNPVMFFYHGVKDPETLQLFTDEVFDLKHRLISEPTLSAILTHQNEYDLNLMMFLYEYVKDAQTLQTIAKALFDPEHRLVSETTLTTILTQQDKYGLNLMMLLYLIDTDGPTVYFVTKALFNTKSRLVSKDTLTKILTEKDDKSMNVLMWFYKSIKHAETLRLVTEALFDSDPLIDFSGLENILRQRNTFKKNFFSYFYGNDTIPLDLCLQITDKIFGAYLQSPNNPKVEATMVSLFSKQDSPPIFRDFYSYIKRFEDLSNPKNRKIKTILDKVSEKIKKHPSYAVVWKTTK